MEWEAKSYKEKNKDANPIVIFILDKWYSVVKQLKLGKELGLLRWIAYDEEFKPGKFDSNIKELAVKGIAAICTLENWNFVKYLHT